MTRRLQNAIRRLAGITLAWMAVEASVSLVAAWRARSAALLIFGGDSIVELLSAGLVLAVSRRGPTTPPRGANQAAALLPVALAAAVVAIATLQLAAGPWAEPSRLGIAVLVAAVVIMPVLAARKRSLAGEVGDAILRADAMQSATCAYLAAIALAGQLLSVTLGWRWADPIAALAIVPLVLREAHGVWYGCGCCDA